MSAVLPRTNVNTVDPPPRRATPQGGKRLFIVAESFRGGLEPIIFNGPRDLAQLERADVGIPAYDAVDVALREGVPQVVLSRIVGADVAYATLNLDGTSGGDPYSLVLTANEPGEWANGATGLSGEVTSPSGGSTRQIVLRRAGTVIATSPVFSARADVLAWNSLQTTVTVSLGGENTLPAVAAAADFSGGDSDSGAITTDDVGDAATRLRKDLGNGQLIAPGRSTVDTSTVLLQHCMDFDRTAYLEVADGLEVDDIVELALTLRGLGSNATGLPRLGGLWAQHATAPGTTPGTTRTVPWTVVQAGLTARLETAEGHPNVAPFGDAGVPQYVTAATRYFSEADAETLFGAGVNIVEQLFGAPRNASFRTLEEDGKTDWLDLAHTRTDRALHADAVELGRGMGSRVINRKTINELAGKMRARLEDRYWKRGAIFGDTPQDAFRVDTDSNNDDASMAAREVNMDIGVVMSEHAEQVNINIAKVPIGQEV